MIKQPSPEDIRAARLRAGLTQAAAAELVHARSYRSWQNWERGVSEIPLAVWELFGMKILARDITTAAENACSRLRESLPTDEEIILEFKRALKKRRAKRK